MNNQEVQASISEKVRKYLPDPAYHVFIFGSRARGDSRKYSDFDVAIDGPAKVDLVTIANINEELEESNIPYKIDLVDLHRTNDSFKTSAYKHIIEL